MPRLIKGSLSGISWDMLLILPVGGILLYGLAGLYSAGLSGNFYTSSLFKQLIWVVISFGVVWSVGRIHPKLYEEHAYRLYAVLIMLLLITYFMPAMSGGRRWILLGSLRFQPSEIGKIIIVLALAKFLAENRKNLSKFHFALLPLALAAFPALIVMGQPDLGTAIIFLAVAFAMMFWAGVSMIHLFIMLAPLLSLISGFNFYTFSSWMLILVLVLYFSRFNLKWATINFFMNASFGALAPAIWNMLQPYQKRRVLTLLDPSADPQGAGYQVLQSMTAIGSGGMFGKGLGEGTQTHLRFLPVTDTDFIIAVIGEELGLIAILTILILYSWMLLRLVDRASTTQYQTASLTIIGFTTIFLVHVFVNMGMAIGIMPVTGLPLPFMSYGGSFLLTCALMIGITHYILAQEP